MEASLTLQVKPARTFVKLIVLIHIFAIVCCLSAQVSWLLRLALAMVPILHMLKYITKYKTDTIVQVSFNDSQWLLQTVAGKLYHAKLLGDSFVSRTLIILNFKIIGRIFCKTVMVDANSMHADQFRRLHILLNTKGRRL